MIKFARARGCRRRRFHSFDKLLDRRTFAEVHHLVRVRHPEIDFVFRLQLVPQRFFAVHKRSVPAAHVFQYHHAVCRHNLRLLPADAAVAQRQFVSRLTPNAKWRSGHHHLAIRAIRFNHNETRRSRHVFWFPPRSRTAQRKYLAQNFRTAPRRAPWPPHMVGKLAPEVKSGACKSIIFHSFRVPVAQPLLAARFWRKLCTRSGRPPQTLGNIFSHPGV